MRKQSDEADLSLKYQRTKRPHKKSRSGCLTCKRRRVKCDEGKPGCMKCRIKGLECAFVDGETTPNDSPPSTASADRSVSSGRTSTSPAETSPGPVYTDLDAKLALHYHSHTVETFIKSCTSTAQSYMWRAFFPSLALVCPIVRLGLLTIAAMCLHFDEHEQTMENYLEAAEAHGKAFFRESATLLNDLRVSQLASAITCSRMLCVLGLVFFRQHRVNGVTIDQSEAWTWLHLLRGVTPVYVAVKESGQPLDPAAAQDMIREVAPGRRLWSSHHGQKHFDEHTLAYYIAKTREERFAALRGSVASYATSVVGLSKCYLDAIDILEDVTAHICSENVQSLFRSLVTFAGSMPKVFAEKLISLDPLALAIYSHWLMLVILVEDLWWVGDMGKTGIREIVDLCSSAGPEVRALLDWPQRACLTN